MSDAPPNSDRLEDIAPGVWRVALDGLAVPVLLLGRDGEIVYCNQFGDAFLRAAKVFRRLNGRLSVRRKHDDEAVMSALDRVHRTRVHELLRLRLRTGEVSCLLHLDPAPDSELVVATIAELRLAPDRAPGWSGLLLGLRNADIRLSESIANGQTLQEAADQDSTPIGTLRTRLKKLFIRTGTDSQTRLAAMLLRSAVLFLERR